MRAATTLIFALLLLFGPRIVLGQDKNKSIELAPVPSAMVNAKKIFIVNGGGNDELYDLFYAEMKSWGKYQLVGSSEEAELIFDFSFGSQGEAPRVYTNPANLRTYSYTVNKLKLVIYDPKTRDAIWSSMETPESARREKNREKKRKTRQKNQGVSFSASCPLTHTCTCLHPLASFLPTSHQR